MSSLDNGVIKGRKSGPGNKQGRSLNFYDAIAKGENEHGQTTIAPAAVIREGKCVYDQERYPNDQQGSRWKPKKY